MARPITLTSLRLAAFRQARALAQSGDETGAKALRTDIWADIRAQFGIPPSTKLKVELDAVDAPDYLVLKDKANDHWLYEADGRFSHTEAHDAPAADAAPSSSQPAPATSVPQTVRGAHQYYRIPLTVLADLAQIQATTGGDVGVEYRDDRFRLAVDGDDLLVSASL